MFDERRVLSALRQTWSAGTSSRWSRANPARGQCSVTALVVQDHLGGALLKTQLAEGWHFYNEIGGRIYDFTADQFREPIEYTGEFATRDEAFADTSREQYECLGAAFSRIWPPAE